MRTQLAWMVPGDPEEDDRHHADDATDECQQDAVHERSNGTDIVGVREKANPGPENWQARV